MEKQALEILLETDAFIAINKPSGLLSIPDRLGKEISLKVLLQQKYAQIFTVHRLDKDTSGVIVFAKTEEAHKLLSAQFEGREVEKFYLGLVHGNPYNENGSIEVPIMEHFAKNGSMITHVKGKAAHTDYQVLEKFRNYAWMQFQIHTGRTHQIRVHMKHIGHSIVCDELYGDGKAVLLSSFKKKFNLSLKDDDEKPLLNRLALHSNKLLFTLHNQDYTLEATPPKDLRALLQQLRKWKG